MIASSKQVKKMCLYPTRILNKKYLWNMKNKGIIPVIKDERTRYVDVPCGKCIECMQQRARNWQVRLIEEIKHDNQCYFTTLTFSNESLQQLDYYTKKKNLKDWKREPVNMIATAAVKLFRERWRKKFKKSPKHWLVTELGHEGTERLHLHGLLWTTITDKEIEQLWSYGWIWNGKAISEKTINYIVKYVTKQDELHKNYKPIILTSPGIGKGYLERYDATRNIYKGEQTNVMYKTESG